MTTHLRDGSVGKMTYGPWEINCHEFLLHTFTQSDLDVPEWTEAA